MQKELDDVLINKIASIERCIKRAREEYNKSQDFKNDFTNQDAATLNILRACELIIDIANYVIKKKDLGIPNSAKDSFDLLHQNKIIDEEICEKMKKMVGFRNISIHEYEEINIDIIEAVVKSKLDDLLDFSRIILKQN